MSKGYEVVVTGEYVAKSGVMGKERILKPYKIKCIVPSTDAVLSVIKNKILGPKLKQEKEDYLMFRTHHILAINPLSEEDRFGADLQNIRYMDRAALEALVKSTALAVPVHLYPSLFKLREAVQFAANDPKGYAKHLEIHKADLELDVEVAKLNPDLQQEDSEIYENTAANPQIKTPAPKAVPGTPISQSRIDKQTEDRIGGLEADMKNDGELGDMDEEKVGGEQSLEDI